jgi:hypothetical protein
MPAAFMYIETMFSSLKIKIKSSGFQNGKEIKQAGPSSG